MANEWPRVGDGKFPYANEHTMNDQDERDAMNPNAAPDIRPMSARDAENDGRAPTGPAARRVGRPRKAASAPATDAQKGRKTGGEK